MLEIRGLRKAFDGQPALDGVSFSVKTGEIVALLGPSGSGKSTLLSIVAGLDRADRGAILWDGKNMVSTPAHRRGFGLMFQDYALFPHRDVFGNVAFSLQLGPQSAAHVRQRVSQMLQLVRLAGFEQRNVSSLSGGEQQRVALARALAPQPRLLMLDEPLGSVDRTLRERLMFELRHILHRMQQTAMYVTHDQEEAFAIADRVVLLRAGRVEQIGAPQEIYLKPASLFVARFLGLTNLLEGEVRSLDGRAVVETAIGNIPVPGYAEGSATVLLRPDVVSLDSREGYQLNGKVVETSFRGSICRTVIEVNGAQLTFDFPSSAPVPGVGEEVVVSFEPERAVQVFQATQT
jgi:ABC-type Fe3+/spermidine/putrescine transport system ATPase subunit